jgi:hypothetical protein
MRKESEFSLHVNGLFLMKGDSSSMGVVFGNLDGMNFMPVEGGGHITWIAHDQWLAMMADTTHVALNPGMPIEMRTPEGDVMLRSMVAKSIPENYQELFALMKQEQAVGEADSSRHQA